MIQRICPVCDQVMKSAHYCRTCRSWVKDPWVREINYYLNERHPQNETGCSYHEAEQERDYRSRAGKPSAQPNVARTDGSVPDRSWTNLGRTVTARQNAGQWNAGQRNVKPRHAARTETSKNNKNINLVLIIIIAIYMTFMLVGAGLVGSMRNSLFGSGSSSLIIGNNGEDFYGTAPAEQVYHELEDAAVIAAGEACSSRGHFDIQGEELQQPLEEVLESLGYELEDCYQYSTNEIYDSGESWYDTVISMDLAQDESSTYQYIEINYDTATGALHEVDVVMADGSGAAAAAVAALKYLEDADAISKDQACSELVEEELRGRILSGDNLSYVFGDVEISVFSHSDSYGIYISHIRD